MLPQLFRLSRALLPGGVQIHRVRPVQRGGHGVKRAQVPRHSLLLLPEPADHRMLGFGNAARSFLQFRREGSQLWGRLPRFSRKAVSGPDGSGIRGEIRLQPV